MPFPPGVLALTCWVTAWGSGQWKKTPGSPLPPLISMQVPNNRNVKVVFKVFLLLEPNVPLGECPKDYVEINGEK